MRFVVIEATHVGTLIVGRTALLRLLNRHIARMRAEKSVRLLALLDFLVLHTERHKTLAVTLDAKVVPILVSVGPIKKTAFDQ